MGIIGGCDICPELSSWLGLGCPPTPTIEERK
jgi:hypothetical protein